MLRARLADQSQVGCYAWFWSPACSADGYLLLLPPAPQDRSNLLTGVVVDSGDGCTHIIPVVDGGLPAGWGGVGGKGWQHESHGQEWAVDGDASHRAKKKRLLLHQHCFSTKCLTLNDFCSALPKT